MSLTLYILGGIVAYIFLGCFFNRVFEIMDMVAGHKDTNNFLWATFWPFSLVLILLYLSIKGMYFVAKIIADCFSTLFGYNSKKYE